MTYVLPVLAGIGILWLFVNLYKAIRCVYHDLLWRLDNRIRQETDGEDRFGERPPRLRDRMKKLEDKVDALVKEEK